jgi:hypothetical protein
MKNQLAEDARALVDQFLRDMTSRGIGVFGLVYQMDPEPAMVVMRNRDSDPIQQAQMVLDIVRAAVHDGRVEHYTVTPVN